MKRFEVLIDNSCVGFVEALEARQALAVAYSDPAYADALAARQVLSLRRDASYGMHILIDTTNNKAIARHDTAKALAALAIIQFANVDTVIVRAGANKHFSIFNAVQLASIAASIGLELPEGDYSARLKALRAGLEACEWLQLPYTTEQLESQAFGIAPTFDRPLAFNPEGDSPKPMKQWHFEPQRNRARQDSPHWIVFRAGLGYGPGVTSPAALAHIQGGPPVRGDNEGPARTAPPAPAGARTKPARPPKAPKAPREPGPPATRPKAGTSTGKVWDLADELWDGGGSSMDAKAFKAALVERCTAEGVNPGTANVQLSKWRSSKAI